MFRIGIDLGGTNIKAVILDKNNRILASDTCPTHASDGFDGVMKSICGSVARMQASLSAQLTDSGDISPDPKEAAFSPASFCGGMTVPGQICGPGGPVLYAPNIGWHDVDPVGYLRDHLGISFKLANDADAIALAEAVVGAGADYPSILMLALGTGVGGAYILDRKIFDGFGLFGGEFGHIPLVHGGRPCPCGITGCFEQYCSASGLARIAREALEENLKACKDSTDHGDACRVTLLWDLCGHDPERLNTVHLFEAAKKEDPTAVRVLTDFFDHLSEGITGLVNIFSPGAVIIGGGLAEAGDALFIPVNERVSRMTYGSSYIPAPPVLKASGGIYTGAVGAALLQEA